MDEAEDITQKKTLRLKNAPGDDEGAEPVSPVSSIGTITTGGGSPRSKQKGHGFSTGAAIVTLVATVLFAALVILQVMELQTYRYAFPRPQLQTVP